MSGFWLTSIKNGPLGKNVNVTDCYSGDLTQTPEGWIDLNQVIIWGLIFIPEQWIFKIFIHYIRDKQISFSFFHIEWVLYGMFN